MRFLSLFSGIEAASVAWKPLGWKAAAVAEIEPFPCAVLSHHYPDVPNLGDVTKYKEWPDLGTVDVVCGGSPCQSFSVAGLRQGLADPRGNLSLTFLAVVDKYRPRYVVWENVPGVLSSNGGRDFASFLGGLGQLGYGWSYRVLDAQYARVDGFPYAVPQRRRRVVVVGYLGDWRRAAAVLSEPESVLGDTPPSRKAGQAVAAAAMQGADGGGWPAEVAPTLGTAWADRHPGSSMQDWISQKGGLFVPAHVDPVASCVTRGFAQRIDAETENFVAHSLSPEVPEVAGTMKACTQSGGFSNSADHAAAGYMIPMTFSQTIPVNETVGAMCAESGPNTHGSRGVSGSQTMLSGYIQPVSIAFAQNTRDEVRLFGGDGQTVGALAAEPGMKQQSYVAHAIQAGATREKPSSGPDGVGVQEGVAYTLEARPEVQAVQSAWAVRRLTPVECARLQGFPEYQWIMDVDLCCTGQAENSANAVMQNLKSQEPALSAAALEFRQSAKSAEKKSALHRPSHEKHAALHVRINCGRMEVVRRNQDGSFSPVNIAGEGSSYRLPMHLDDFARLVARMTITGVPITPAGGEGLQETSSTYPLSGRKRVDLSGQETMQRASDAAWITEQAKRISTSITSIPAQSSQTDQQTLETWFSFAAAAIASFIPEQTRQEISSIRFEVIESYLTQVEWRGKTPPADGPMYKALGNSWAVNVFRWVGRRIEMVEEIAKEIAA